MHPDHGHPRPDAAAAPGPVAGGRIGAWTGMSLHERDAGVRAAWSDSFLGQIPGEDLRHELLAESVVSTFAAGHLVQESDYRWTTEPYPVTLVVDGVFRGYLRSPLGRQATIQYSRCGDSWGLARTISQQSSFEQHLHWQALVPSRLLMIRGSRFRAAVERDPAVGLALARELARLMMLRTGALEVSVFADTATRVAQHITQVASVDDESGVLTVWLSQQELADAVGTVREVVTRVLGRFRRRGIVRYAGRKLEILDVDALAREAEIQ